MIFLIEREERKSTHVRDWRTGQRMAKRLSKGGKTAILRHDDKNDNPIRSEFYKDGVLSEKNFT